MFNDGDDPVRRYQSGNARGGLAATGETVAPAPASVDVLRFPGAGYTGGSLANALTMQAAPSR